MGGFNVQARIYLTFHHPFSDHLKSVQDMGANRTVRVSLRQASCSAKVRTAVFIARRDKSSKLNILFHVER